MMRDFPRLLLAVCLSCAALAAWAEPALRLADLQPVETLDGFSPDEASIGVWVRFGRGWIPRKASSGSPTGLFELRLDSRGVPVAVLRALPTEILGDCTMTGRDPVSKGDWHHYEIVYSRADRRAAFYVDGRLQWENATPYLPRLAAFEEALQEPTEDFNGEVAGLTVWDAPLDVEALLPVGDEESDPCDTASRQRLAERLAANLLAIGDARGPGVLYAVDPVDSRPCLPYDLPADGECTDEAAAVVAPGERALFSFVLVAKLPLTVREVVVSDFLGDGSDLPSANCDVRLVKRWFRPGLAGGRVLVPDLLLHDDALVRVDECRGRNSLRVSDGEDGDVYVDVSDPEGGELVFRGGCGAAFKDADTLQPVEIPEMGRNQQFLFAMNVARGVRPGTYVSYVRFRTTMGELSAKLRLRVADVDLPSVPACAHDAQRAFAPRMDADWEAQGGDGGLNVVPVPSFDLPLADLRQAVGLRAWSRGADGVRLGRWQDARRPFNVWRENFVAGAEAGGRTWVYPQDGGFLPTLRSEALREGVADVLWATRLQQLCAAFEDSADDALRTAARRDRRWLRGLGARQVRVTRRALQVRVLDLQRLVAERGAALPAVVKPHGVTAPVVCPPREKKGFGLHDAEEKLLARVAADWRVPARRARRAVSLRTLGDFYRGWADDLAGDAARRCREKAVRCYEAALNAVPEDARTVGDWRPLVETAFSLGDLDRIERVLPECAPSVADAREQEAVDAAKAAWLGDLAYARGDYEAAVAAYTRVNALDARPSAASRGECAWDRYAAALYATGRYEQCLEILPRLANWGSLAARNMVYAECVRSKIGER